MAKTTIRKNKIKQNPQTEVGNIGAIKSEDLNTISYPDVLSASHLLQLETLSRDVENARLLMNLEEQAFKNLLLERALLEVKIEKQKQLVAMKHDQYKNKTSSLTCFQKDIWPQYGLREDQGLGYDPISGKIHINHGG